MQPESFIQCLPLATQSVSWLRCSAVCPSTSAFYSCLLIGSPKLLMFTAVQKETKNIWIFSDTVMSRFCSPLLWQLLCGGNNEQQCVPRAPHVLENKRNTGRLHKPCCHGDSVDKQRNGMKTRGDDLCCMSPVSSPGLLSQIRTRQQ